MAQCWIFRGENYSGNSQGLHQDEPNLQNLSGRFPQNNWDDEISSIKIIAGVWRFFEQANYQGLYKDLGPGMYPDVTKIGISDNSISSAKVLR